MPWNPVEPMMQRKELIEKMLLENTSVVDLCRTYNVSRKTAYKWLARYQQEGLSGLYDQARIPKHNPNQTDTKTERLLIEAHHEFPYWGPRKLKQYLQNKKPLKKLPAVSTISQVLKRHGCEVIKNTKSAPATTRFERDQPNELWQMDFKGSFMTAKERCFPLTILDDHSRFLIGLKACLNERGVTVKGHLIPIFKEFGLPEQINVDNGNPWGNRGAGGVEGYTAIEVWLLKLNIVLTHSAPYHPQTNGKDERFHRTLKLELLNQQSFNNCREAQKHFIDWQHQYNFIRPHDALKGKPPSSRYRSSQHHYPERLPEPVYEAEAVVRKCHAETGTIRYKGKRYRVGKGFGGEWMALKETDRADEVSVFFMDHWIKKINLADSVD